MKKFLKTIFVTTVATVFAVPLCACSGSESDDVINVYMPDGAPAVALSSFMDSGYENTKFTVVGSAEEIAAKVSSGAADMAIVPINQAAKMYNTAGKIVMLSVNTHGNLYIVGNEVEGLDGLVGKTLGVIGQSNVPDFTLRMLLEEKNIPYATTEISGGNVQRLDGKIGVYYASDAKDLLPLFKTGKVDYALLGEPAATNSGGNVAINIQTEWQSTMGGEFPQACLIATKSLVNGNKSYVDKFLSDLKKNDGWASANADKALDAIKKNMEQGRTTTLTALTADIVERCNIKTVSALDGKPSCEKYFEKLVGMSSLGITVLDKAPDASFYYQA